MKQFLVRNLMVDVLSSELTQRFGELCRFPTRDCLLTDYCIQPTFCNARTIVGCFQQTLIPCRWGTDQCFITDGCGLNYSTCFAGTQTIIIDIEQLIINPADVKIVRQQLDEALEVVERRGPELAAEMQPKTREQAELLEEQLSAALKEVQELKERLG